MKQARRRHWLVLAFRAFRKGQRESMQAVRRHNEECRRQSLLIANDPREAEMQEWLEQVQDIEGWAA